MVQAAFVWVPSVQHTAQNISYIIKQGFQSNQMENGTQTHTVYHCYLLLLLLFSLLLLSQITAEKKYNIKK